MFVAHEYLYMSKETRKEDVFSISAGDDVMRLGPRVSPEKFVNSRL